MRSVLASSDYRLGLFINTTPSRFPYSALSEGSVYPEASMTLMFGSRSRVRRPCSIPLIPWGMMTSANKMFLVADGPKKFGGHGQQIGLVFHDQYLLHLDLGL